MTWGKGLETKRENQREKSNDGREGGKLIKTPAINNLPQF